MFLKIVLHSLTRRCRRKIVAVASVWIGISLIAGLLILCNDVGDKMSLELRSFGANIRVESLASAVPFRVGDYQVARSRGPAYLEESDIPHIKEIFWRNNILGIVPRLQGEGRVNGKDVRLLGVWFEHRILIPGGEPFMTGARQVYRHWNVRGTWPSSGSEEEALVGEDLARRLVLSPGSRVRVKSPSGSWPLTVSGIASTGGRDDSAIIAPLTVVQGLASLQGKVSDIDVSALTTPENKLVEKYHQDPRLLTPQELERWFCTPYPGSVAAAIEKVIPGSAARVVRRVSETQGAVLTRIKGLMLFLACAVLVACCLSVAGSLAAAIMERRTEVALLQAIGAHRGAVLLLCLTESALIGGAGGILAALTGPWIGGWLTRAIFESEPSIHLAPIFLAPFLGMLTAGLGSLWPVWQALNQDVAQVLHGS